MKINRIELYNIGSYEGLNVFDIAAQNPNGKVSVIGGKNGAGKTTLFSGIKLCLYGYREAGYQAINNWYKNSIKRLINVKTSSSTDIVKISPSFTKSRSLNSFAEGRPLCPDNTE